MCLCLLSPSVLLRTFCYISASDIIPALNAGACNSSPLKGVCTRNRWERQETPDGPIGYHNSLGMQDSRHSSNHLSQVTLATILTGHISIGKGLMYIGFQIAGPKSRDLLAKVAKGEQNKRIELPVADRELFEKGVPLAQYEKMPMYGKHLHTFPFQAGQPPEVWAAFREAMGLPPAPPEPVDTRPEPVAEPPPPEPRLPRRPEPPEPR